jgi:hypothetical protein
MRVQNGAGFALAVAALGLAGAMGCSSGSGVGSCVSYCEKMIWCQRLDGGSNETADCQAECEMFDAGGTFPCNSSELYDCLNRLSCTELNAYCPPLCTSGPEYYCIQNFCPHG